MSKYIGTPVVNVSVDTVDVTGDITTTDTTPEVIIVNNTHEDTDGGREGKVTFKGQQSGGEETTLAQIQASHDGTSDDEKGDLIFKTNDGSDGASPTEVMRLDSSGNVGIGTSTPSNLLHVEGAFSDTSQGVVANFDSGNAGIGSGPIVKWTNDFAEAAVTMLNTASGSSALTFETMSSSSLTERMRIASDGKVGIGTTSPSNNLTIEGASYTLFGMKRDTSVTTGTGEFAMHVETNSQVSISYDDEGSVVFGTAGTPTTAAGFSEKMRLDASGNLLVGTSSTFDSTDASNGGDNKFGFIGGRLDVDRNSSAAAAFKRTSSNGTLIHLCRGGSGAVGSISVDTGAAAFNTSSDYRLKENVETLSGAITRVKQLNPKRFSWIVDEEDSASRDGFLAHEAQTVVPEAVTGTHNGMMDQTYVVSAATGDVYTPPSNATYDEDGNQVSAATNEIIHSSDVEEPSTLEEGQRWRETTAAEMGTRSVPEYQGIDQAKLVPLLTAALQEAIAKIETLETKVAALEGE